MPFQFLLWSFQAPSILAWTEQSQLAKDFSANLVRNILGKLAVMLFLSKLSLFQISTFHLAILNGMWNIRNPVFKSIGKGELTRFTHGVRELIVSINQALRRFPVATATACSRRRKGGHGRQ